MCKCLFVILVIFLNALNASAQSENIEWQKDYGQALALSRETGKPLLLDFTAKWCAPCQAMERDFWTRSDVAEASKRFVAVKIDYDSQKPLVNRFAVRGLPYIAFSDPIGNLITSRNSFGQNGAETLKQLSEQMPKDFSPLANAYQAFDLNNNDGFALLEIADFYRVAGLFALSSDFYLRAAKSPAIKNDAEKKERLRAAVGLNLYNSNRFQPAIENLESYLKDFPSGKNRETIFSALVVSHVKLGKFAEAEAYLEMIKTNFPESKNIALGKKIIEEAKLKTNK